MSKGQDMAAAAKKNSEEARKRQQEAALPILKAIHERNVAIVEARIEAKQPPEGGWEPLMQEYAESIKADWHSSRHKFLRMGRTLIEAKRNLPHGYFTKLIEDILPFTAEHARTFMRLAADPRFSNQNSSSVLPESVKAMDELRKLDDHQFEAAIASGVIHPEMTVTDARDYVRGLKANSPHRPLHTAIMPPAPPEGFQMGTAGAAAAQPTTYSELVWLLIQRRHALGYSQEALDHLCGWTAGMTSKLEIPHANDGRFAGALTLNVWLTALRATVQVVGV